MWHTTFHGVSLTRKPSPGRKKENGLAGTQGKIKTKGKSEEERSGEKQAGE